MSDTNTRDMPSCYLCGATGKQIYRKHRDRMYAAPGEWDTRECPRCGLAWLDPQPLPAMFSQLYASYYTHEESLPPARPPLRKRLRTIGRAAVLSSAFGYESRDSPAAHLLGRLLSLIPAVRDTVGFSVRWLPAGRRGRLLDVGCGSGEFLVGARTLGWEVAGLEPDPAAGAFAREHHGLPVETATPETSALPAGSFDAITLNHVIEHVADPIATLRACARLLRVGGLLVVVTPNTDSLGRRIYGGAWMHWDPPRHFYLFNRDTLRTCAQRAGLAVERIRTPAQGVRPSWGTSRLIRRYGRGSSDVPAGHRGGRILLEMFGLLLESLMVGLGQPAGEEVVLFATRTE